MATWMTESDINCFLDYVPPCGRGQSLKVLQYLQQKGISPSCSSSLSSRASSVASFSAGSDVEDRNRIFPVKARSLGTCAGRGMVSSYDRDRALSFEGERERWDNAVYSQLRRANRNSYTTDAFEYQVKMMHKAQEEKERVELFEEATGDDTSSIGTSASHIDSIAPSSSPSSFSSCGFSANLSEMDLEDKTKQNFVTTDLEDGAKINCTADVEDEVKGDHVVEDVVQQPKPVYKSVRSRNVLLNALAKMALAQSSVQEPVAVDQVGTEYNAQASSSSVVTSDDSASESPLIFDSASSSPQPDLYYQNCVSDGVYDYRQGFNDDTLVSSQEVPNNNQLFFDDDDDVDNTVSSNREEINYVRPPSDIHFKKLVDYPSIVGQYYNNNSVDVTPVNPDDAQCIYKANTKSCRFAPPSLIGLESLDYSPSKMNRYNAEFELKLEEFPPLK